MVTQVRGNHGSGKSTVVRRVMEHYPTVDKVFASDVTRWEDLASKPNECLGYSLKGGIFVVGAYDAPTGGCDLIKKQDHINERVKWAAGLGYNVLFEGILASITYERYAFLATLLAEDEIAYEFLFLTPSKETCFEHINARRQTSKMVRKPFKESLFDLKAGCLTRCTMRYKDEGYTVVEYPTAYEAADYIIERFKR